jgi:Flp pilus assembly pilin Flp
VIDAETGQPKTNAALIAVVIIVAITAVGTDLSAVFNTVANSLASATS